MMAMTPELAPTERDNSVSWTISVMLQTPGHIQYYNLCTVISAGCHQSNDLQYYVVT